MEVDASKNGAAGHADWAEDLCSVQLDDASGSSYLGSLLDVSQ